MQIRRLSKEDAVMFKALRMEALQTEVTAFAADYEYEVDRDISHYEEWLEEKVVYAAFEGNDMIGVASFVWPKHVKKLCHGGMIQAAYVQKKHRHQGIGTKLFQSILDNLPEEIEKVIIYVVKKNAGAKKLYESLGFKEYAIEEKALKVDNEYYDEYLMVKFVK